MASHPEFIHSGLAKIIQYCDESKDSLDQDEANQSIENKFYRRLLFMPILLLNDDLYEMQDMYDKNLVKVESSILVVNYYRKSEKKMAYVFILTKTGLVKFLEDALDIERKIELRIKEELSKSDT